MNNLSNLALESDECRALVYRTIIGPFLDSVIIRKMGIILETKKWKDQPNFFWKVALREALHAIGLGMFSNKSVMSFLTRIRAKKLKTAWLQCRKDYGVYLQEDGKVFVFYPSSFPWNNNDPYGINGEVHEVGGIKDVGPWRIKSEVVKGTKGSSQMLRKKAVDSMESFMTGSLEYFISVPTFFDKNVNDFIPWPLIFCHFNKIDRPRAWKGCDLRIQKTIPLLGKSPIQNKIRDIERKNLILGVDDSEISPEFTIKITLNLTKCEG